MRHRLKSSPGKTFSKHVKEKESKIYLLTSSICLPVTIHITDKICSLFSLLLSVMFLFGVLFLFCVLRLRQRVSLYFSSWDCNLVSNKIKLREVCQVTGTRNSLKNTKKSRKQCTFIRSFLLFLHCLPFALFFLISLPPSSLSGSFFITFFPFFLLLCHFYYSIFIFFIHVSRLSLGFIFSIPFLSFPSSILRLCLFSPSPPLLSFLVPQVPPLPSILTPSILFSSPPPSSFASPHKPIYPSFLSLLSYLLPTLFPSLPFSIYLPFSLYTCLPFSFSLSSFCLTLPSLSFLIFLLPFPNFFFLLPFLLTFYILFCPLSP